MQVSRDMNTAHELIKLLNSSKVEKIAMNFFKFLCWGCGLWWGNEDELETPSELCRLCKKAKE